LLHVATRYLTQSIMKDRQESHYEVLKRLPTYQDVNDWQIPNHYRYARSINDFAVSEYLCFFVIR